MEEQEPEAHLCNYLYIAVKKSYVDAHDNFSKKLDFINKTFEEMGKTFMGEIVQFHQGDVHFIFDDGFVEYIPVFSTFIAKETILASDEFDIIFNQTPLSADMPEEEVLIIAEVMSNDRHLQHIEELFINLMHAYDYPDSAVPVDVPPVFYVGVNVEYVEAQFEDFFNRSPLENIQDFVGSFQRSKITAHNLEKTESSNVVSITEKPST